MACQLDVNRKYDLLTMQRTAGYQAVLDILEQLCTIAETELLRLDPLKVDGEKILLKFAEARAGRTLFEKFQSEVLYQIAEVEIGNE